MKTKSPPYYVTSESLFADIASTNMRVLKNQIKQLKQEKQSLIESFNAMSEVYCHRFCYDHKDKLYHTKRCKDAKQLLSRLEDK